MAQIDREDWTALVPHVAQFVPSIYPWDVHMDVATCIRVAREAIGDACNFVGPLRKEDFFAQVFEALYRRKAALVE